MFEQLKTPIEKQTDALREMLPESVGGENRGIQPTENALAFAAAIGATFLVRHALQAGWRKTLRREPPKNPTAPTVDWGDALLWGAVSGALIGVARIASRRASSKAYRSFQNGSSLDSSRLD